MSNKRGKSYSQISGDIDLIDNKVHSVDSTYNNNNKEKIKFNKEIDGVE